MTNSGHCTRASPPLFSSLPGSTAMEPWGSKFEADNHSRRCWVSGVGKRREPRQLGKTGFLSGSQSSLLVNCEWVSCGKTAHHSCGNERRVRHSGRSRSVCSLHALSSVRRITFSPEATKEAKVRFCLRLTHRMFTTVSHLVVFQRKFCGVTLDVSFHAWPSYSQHQLTQEGNCGLT